jgi:hypothetical protein
MPDSEKAAPLEARLYGGGNMRRGGESVPPSSLVHHHHHHHHHPHGLEAHGTLGEAGLSSATPLDGDGRDAGRRTANPTRGDRCDPSDPDHCHGDHGYRPDLMPALNKSVWTQFTSASSYHWVPFWLVVMPPGPALWLCRCW